MPDVDQILAEAELRHNPATQGNGLLLRTDVAKYLKENCTDMSIDDRKFAVKTWLGPVAWLNDEQKNKIVNDLESYGTE